MNLADAITSFGQRLFVMFHLGICLVEDVVGADELFLNSEVPPFLVQ